MSVNRSRSMNRELETGAVEGTYKSLEQNVSATHDPNIAKRRQMSWRFGFEDFPIELLPDTGLPAHRAPGSW